MITICIGRMRQGKSTLAKYIANQSPTRIVIDPRRQFHTSPVYISDVTGLYELLDEREEIIVRPGIEGEGIVEPVSEVMLDWIEDGRDAQGSEKICLLVDEANMLGMDAKPQDAYPHFNYLLRSAGEDNINVVLTSHRIVEIHPAIRSIAHYLCMFRTTHTADLKAIEDKCGQEVAEKVATIAPREVLVWDDNFGTYRVETDREKWYVDLDRIPIREEDTNHA